MDEAGATVAASMPTPKFVDHLLSGRRPDNALPWQQAGIVGVLRQAIAEQRAGEWARLDRAVAWVQEKHPRQTPARYGCRSWQQVLNDSGAFELRYGADERGARVAWFKARGAAHCLERNLGVSGVYAPADTNNVQAPSSAADTLRRKPENRSRPTPAW